MNNYLGLGVVFAVVVVWTLIDGKLALKSYFTIERGKDPFAYWTLTGLLALVAAALIDARWL